MFSWLADKLSRQRSNKKTREVVSPSGEEDLHMNIKMKFLGATENVTGSRHFLEVDGTRILVDCGLYQERDLQERNWEPFEVEPGSIDAVLLTHAHLDHCGLLPKLVREGFKGRIYCTEATAEIAEIVMLDCGNLMEEDAEYKKKRHRREGRTPPRPVVPLYTKDDAEAVTPYFSPVKYKKVVKINDCIEISFHEAGHILGSSIIKVKAACGGQSRTILFSGDIGRENKPILKDPDVFEHADYVLVESTYGNRIHHSVEDTKEQIAKAINDAYKAGGNIIVPSFAIERSQELLYYLNELHLESRIPPIKVFLDSPMAIRVTEVFKKYPELYDKETTEYLHNHESPFSFENLTMCRTSKDSKALNDLRGTNMIIAGSGMCTGGRIKHHLLNHISRPESTIMFVGYQAYGTLGRIIVDGEEEIRILGQMKEVLANIVRIHGFSAHADMQEILDWLLNIKQAPRGVFVVHGEKEAAHNLGDFLTDKTGWKVTVPAYKDEVILE